MYLTQPVQLLPLLLLFFSCSSLASIAPSPVEVPYASPPLPPTQNVIAPSPVEAPYASPPLPPTQNVTIEYMDPTFPPHLPTQDPKCSLLVLHQDFSGQSPLAVGTYTPPPECPAPWSRVILDLAASVSDLQKDRIAAIWLDGAEILRTTTPLPMTPSVSWHVRKDITRYTALLHGTNGRSSRFSMMVENSNETFPGVFSINVTLHFYRGAVSEDMTDGRKELS